MPLLDETHRGVKTVDNTLLVGVKKLSLASEMQLMLVKLAWYDKKEMPQNALESLLQKS